MSQHKGNQQVETSEREVGELLHSRMWPYDNCKYMQFDECTPENFLKEISFNIDLDKLYTVADVCYLNNDFNLLGVILRVESKALFHTFHDKKYVFQVWTKDGVKVYQKHFYKRPHMWSSDSYIIFKAGKGEADK